MLGTFLMRARLSSLRRLFSLPFYVFLMLCYIVNVLSGASELAGEAADVLRKVFGSAHIGYTLP